MICVCVRACVHVLLFLQLLSYAEMLASATNICSTLKDIPCIGDGDTGYGNALNVKRTVKGYAQVLAEKLQKSRREFAEVLQKFCSKFAGSSQEARKKFANPFPAAPTVRSWSWSWIGVDCMLQ